MTLFSVEDVPLSGICVLDGSFVTYVLIPPTAPRSKNDIGTALQFAKVNFTNVVSDFKELADRPEVTASVAFVIPGNSAPPHDLKAIFRQWQDQAWPLKASEIHTLYLEDALDTLEKERFTIKDLQSDHLPLGVDADNLEVLTPCVDYS